MSINSNATSVNVICIKWGDTYSANDVNTLYSMILRNTRSFDVNFYCFTENGKDLDPSIHIAPLPVMHCRPEDVKYAYRKEAGLCDDNLGNLTGQRVFFFDLDILITGSMDEIFDFPENDEFVIINDWNTSGDHVGQASCYSWVVGTLGYVKSYFEANPREVVKAFHTASQEYLSSKIIEKYGKLNFWPESWCKSFKFHCIPRWPRRFWAEPKLPEGTKVLAFHGRPKMEDALIGRWAPGGKIPFIKKIYKTIKPALWISRYWY